MDLFLQGLTFGVANGLLAVGLVLVFMSNRVINLAHGEIGMFGVAMFFMLRGTYHWGYWLAVPVAMLSSAALGGVIERVIMQRLFTAPRVVALLATIGISQMVTIGRLILPKPKANTGKAAFTSTGGLFEPPFHFTLHYDRFYFHADSLMIWIIGPLAVIALALFLRRSIYGLSMVAAAQNGSRARLLGIPVRRVSTMSWLIAGGLSGVAAFLLAPVVGYTPTEAVGLPLLMRGLAAASIVEFESVTGAFLWGIALGIVDTAVTYYVHRSGTGSVLVYGVVLLALLARRRRRRRTTASEETSFKVADAVRPLPPEVRAHPRWRATVLGGGSVAAVVVLLGPNLLSSSTAHLMSSVFAVSAVVISLTMLSGWSGQLSMGHWALAGVGGVYGCHLVTVSGWPFWLVFAFVGVVGGIVSFVLGLPALRLPGALLVVVTLGLAIVCESWVFLQQEVKGRTQHLPLPEWVTFRAYYYLCLVFLGVIIAAVTTLQRSRFGRNMTAVRDNPAQASAYGVAIVQTKLIAFVVSGVIASLAGFLWAAGAEASATSFPATRSLGILIAAIIGGLGSVGGAVLGTFYILGIPFLLSSSVEHVELLSSGIGMLLLLLFQPGGLARILFRGRDLLAGAVTGLEPRPTVTPTSHFEIPAVSV